MRMLAAFILLLWSTAAQADRLKHISTFEWPSDSFIGLSGLELSTDGESFQTISDRGWYLSGRLIRKDGVITDVDIVEHLPILGADGLPVAARRIGDWSDAEGLAIAPDGTTWISFERWARVARYDSMRQAAGFIKDHPKFYDYADNRQLEALALHPNGALYTFPEEPDSKGFDAFKLDSNRWEMGEHIASHGGFLIVGADFAPDGMLYLLERKHYFGMWWQSRVRRLRVEAPQDDEILWTSGRGDYNNLEGIAFWQDEFGPRLSLVSDNNGKRGEATQIIEFRVVP